MDFRALAMGLTFALLWSSAFTSARIIVQSAPPLTTLSLRFLVSGLIAIGLAYSLGQRINFRQINWRPVVLFGICQNALYLGLYFMAMQSLEASLAAITASTMPLIVAVIAAVFFGERLGVYGMAGLVIGFIGVGVILAARIQGDVNILGLVYCAVGVTALAIATLTVRSTGAGNNMLMIVGLQMLVGSAALILPALATETLQVEWSWLLFWAFIYTTLAPGLIATLIWFKLVGRIGATKAATYHFLNPFFGVAIAAIVLGEALTLQDIIGVCTIMVGILAVQLSKAKLL